MKIQELHLKNFKRFTSLTIKDIPSEAKLVLLIGSNGSGKSSVFDAFEAIASKKKAAIGLFHPKITPNQYWNYYVKDHDRHSRPEEKCDITLISSDGRQTELNRNTSADFEAFNFYGRSSFRQTPTLTRKSSGGQQINILEDNDRPARYIDRDLRFENDIEKIASQVLDAVFTSSGEEQVKSIRNRFIEPINLAFGNMYGQSPNILQLKEISPPLDGKEARIIFTKGVSTIHYDLLSTGEKEIFNILINLLARGDVYQDTIYFFDELDLHLNTKIQFSLLKELTENWIPENCQLWTASHSLGFIEYAKQSSQAAIIDFDDLDFDIEQVLTPVPKDSTEIYEIAVSKDILPSLFRDRIIFFVENTDQSLYANLNIENVLFVSDNNKSSVYHKVKASGSGLKGIVDRDFLTDSDVEEIVKAYPDLRILGYYSIENYLYHPENLAEYFAGRNISFDREKYMEAVVREKNAVAGQIIPSLSLDRASYPFFGEPAYNGKPQQNRFRPKSENKEQAAKVAEMLQSDDFEVFYKVLPMKEYCTQLPQRQNIAKSELSKTNWFKRQIESVTRKRG